MMSCSRAPDCSRCPEFLSSAFTFLVSYKVADVCTILPSSLHETPAYLLPSCRLALFSSRSRCTLARCVSCVARICRRPEDHSLFEISDRSGLAPGRRPPQTMGSDPNRTGVAPVATRAEKSFAQHAGRPSRREDTSQSSNHRTHSDEGLPH